MNYQEDASNVLKPSRVGPPMTSPEQPQGRVGVTTYWHEAQRCPECLTLGQWKFIHGHYDCKKCGKRNDHSWLNRWNIGFNAGVEFAKQSATPTPSLQKVREALELVRGGVMWRKSPDSSGNHSVPHKQMDEWNRAVTEALSLLSQPSEAGDKERLDWLERNALEIQLSDFRDIPATRQAIDKEMK